MGRSAALTSAVVTWSTPLRPRYGYAYWRSVVCQFSAVLPPAFHAVPWIASTLPTASSKVGMPGSRRGVPRGSSPGFHHHRRAAGSTRSRRGVPRGSSPERATLRLVRARSSASGTSAKLPRPSAQAFPWLTSRCTQWRDPDGSTCRYSPLPSQYLLGWVTVRQKAANYGDAKTRAASNVRSGSRTDCTVSSPPATCVSR